MARNVDVSEILRRAEKRADIENSNFYSPQDKLDIVSSAYTELYDLLVMSNEHYYKTSTTINTVNGQRAYDLPDDFYKLLGAEEKDGSRFVTMYRYPYLERNQSFADDDDLGNRTVRLNYIPAPNQLTSTSDTVDGVSGWEELIVLLTARAFLVSEESPTGAIDTRIQQMKERIENMSHNRDQGMPQTVGDIYRSGYYVVGATLMYEILGDKIEFVNREYLGNDYFGF